MRRTALIALLFAAAPLGIAQAQVAVSTGNTLAYNCYLSALATVHNKLAVGDGIGACNAALEDGLDAKGRAGTLDNRGILLFAKARYPEAWDDFNHSIKLDETLGDAWLNRGVSRIHMKQPQEALADIQKGIALSISLPQIGYYDLGVADENLGKFTEAYLAFKQSLALDPSFTAASDELKNFVVTTAPAKTAQP